MVGTKGQSTGIDLGAKGISAYVQEHIDMVDSILGRGKYVNQAVPIAESTLTCIMGRESGLFGDGGDLGPDHEFEAGPDAEGVRV